MFTTNFSNALSTINTNMHMIGKNVASVLFGAKPGTYNRMLAHRKARLFYKNKKQAEIDRIQKFTKANVVPMIMLEAQYGKFSYTYTHMPDADWKIAAKYLRSIGYRVTDKRKGFSTINGSYRLMVISW